MSLRSKFFLVLVVAEKIKNHLKSAAQRENILARYYKTDFHIALIRFVEAIKKKLKEKKMKQEKCSKKCSERKNLKQGFTLLELLVVVVIIGILASIALPQYKYAVTKAKFAQLLTATRAIVEAQRRYILLHGERSLDLSALDIDIQGGTYNNAKDKITFDWGDCVITSDAGRTGFSCGLNKPYMRYFRIFNSEVKRCCASAKSGEIGKKLCQAEFPNAIGRASDSSCGSGGTLYGDDIK